MSTKARYTTAADALVSWRDDVLTGKAPTLYPLGTGELARIEVGPGLVILIGGAPGAGKTGGRRIGGQHGDRQQLLGGSCRQSNEIDALHSPHVVC